MFDYIILTVIMKLVNIFSAYVLAAPFIVSLSSAKNYLGLLFYHTMYVYNIFLIKCLI